MTQPAVFISHGSPMVAIQTGAFQEALARFGRDHRPAAIVAVSAHWETGAGIRIASAPVHEPQYDFGGFPRALYEIDYRPPGDPALARRIQALLDARLDPGRALDHGVWIPLRLMYANADVPVVEISLDGALDPEALFGMGRALAPLRSENIMILGSGGIVHNLARVDFAHRERPPETWAERFDTWFKERLEAGDLDALLHARERGPHADLAIPTSEHFDPVFVVLGAASNVSAPEHIYEGFEHGTLSMRSFALP